MKSFLWTPPCGVGAIHGYVSLGVTRRKDLPRNSVAELSPWMAQASALEAETSGVIQLFSIWARVIVQSESCRGAGGVQPEYAPGNRSAGGCAIATPAATDQRGRVFGRQPEAFEKCPAPGTQLISGRNKGGRRAHRNCLSVCSIKGLLFCRQCCRASGPGCRHR